jgi:hypothetical protein
MESCCWLRCALVPLFSVNCDLIFVGGKTSCSPVIQSEVIPVLGGTPDNVIANRLSEKYSVVSRPNVHPAYKRLITPRHKVILSVGVVGSPFTGGSVACWNQTHCRPIFLGRNLSDLSVYLLPVNFTY